MNFPYKTFRVQFIFILLGSPDPLALERSRGGSPLGTEEKLAWNYLNFFFFFNYMNAAKLNSLRKFLLLQYVPCVLERSQIFRFFFFFNWSQGKLRSFTKSNKVSQVVSVDTLPSFLFLTSQP